MMKLKLFVAAMAFAIPSVQASKFDCRGLSGLAEAVLQARYQGVSKSDLIEALRSDAFGLEMIDQVFGMTLATDELGRIDSIVKYRELWYDECAKINEETQTFFKASYNF